MIRVKVNTIVNKGVGLKRLLYVLDFINNHPFTKNRFQLYLNDLSHDVEINYTGNLDVKEPAIQIFASHHFFGDKNVKTSELKFFDFDKEGKRHYSLFKDFKTEADKIKIIPYDIFETIFFLISRIEEKELPQQDFLGNKEEFETQFVAVKNGLHKIPVVDNLVRMLLEVITGSKTESETIYALSHDIDSITKFSNPAAILKKIGGHFYNRKSFIGIKHLLNGFKNYLLNGEDPYDTFDWMLIQNKSIEKQIYFLSGGQHRLDTPYDQSSDYFKMIINQAKTDSYQIGIHPSYESWNNERLISKEKLSLEEIVDENISCSRQHYLNFDIVKTPQLLLKAGVNRDSSLGFTRHIGFRCGTGFPYFLYDFINEAKSELLEDPLVFMDTSCLHECGYQSTEYMNRMISFLTSNANNTRILFNFHNSFFDEAALRNIPLKNWYLDTFGSRKR